MEQSKISELESKIAELKAMRYTDGVGIDLYKNIVAYSNAADAKIASNLKDVMSYIVELDKNVALNKQATDYQFVILNNKIDCCCEKQRMQAEFDRCYNQLADSSIISYINSTFIPGQLWKICYIFSCPKTPLIAGNSDRLKTKTISSQAQKWEGSTTIENT